LFRHEDRGTFGPGRCHPGGRRARDPNAGSAERATVEREHFVGLPIGYNALGAEDDGALHQFECRRQLVLDQHQRAGRC
jgi:hypothetical protein